MWVISLRLWHHSVSIQLLNYWVSRLGEPTGKTTWIMPNSSVVMRRDSMDLITIGQFIGKWLRGKHFISLGSLWHLRLGYYLLIFGISLSERIVLFSAFRIYSVSTKENGILWKHKNWPWLINKKLLNFLLFVTLQVLSLFLVVTNNSRCGTGTSSLWLFKWLVFLVFLHSKFIMMSTQVGFINPQSITISVWDFLFGSWQSVLKLWKT